MEKPSSAKSARSHNVSELMIMRQPIDFVELQEMGLEPRKHMYVEVDFRSSKLLAQSASEYVVRLEVELLRM